MNEQRQEDVVGSASGVAITMVKEPVCCYVGEIRDKEPVNSVTKSEVGNSGETHVQTSPKGASYAGRDAVIQCKLKGGMWDCSCHDSPEDTVVVDTSSQDCSATDEQKRDLKWLNSCLDGIIVSYPGF